MAQGKTTRARPDALSMPHRQIKAHDPRDRLTLELFDALWSRYRQRVPHVQAYERMIREAGGTFVNDHIAFRTIACQTPTTGIVTIARIFAALGYRAAGSYQFPDKHLASSHYQHPTPGFPKLFISELELWELPSAARKMIRKSLSTHRDPVSDETLAALRNLDKQDDAGRAKLLRKLVRFFHGLPWDPPAEKIVLSVNEVSQFAAWVLVHGYNVNHFTALINSHGVEPLDDIDKTIQRLQEAGIPMKAVVEGPPGSKLRQTATGAAVIDVPVRKGQGRTKIPWTYAYFELAERGNVPDPSTGQPVRFEGFLGPQATHLFEMTRIK